MEGGAGDDTIVPAPGAPFPNDGFYSAGGPGEDRLVGLRNSGGRDLSALEGGADDDVLIGGRGRDEISGGRGDDRINSRDSKRDIVRCGPGRDRVKADRQDWFDDWYPDCPR